MMRKIITCMDIGSDLIKVVVGEMIKNKLNILASSSSSSSGIKKGFVVDPQALMPRLEEAIHKCETILGLKITETILCVPSDNSEFFLSEGYTTITNDEHLIKKIDIVHAIQASTYNKVDNGREIVAIYPTSFNIDDTHTVKEPLGLEATKLSVKVLAVTIPRKNVYPISKCLETIGIKVVDYSLGIIGDYWCHKKPMMNDCVGAFINIGYQTVIVGIFNKGFLTNTEVLDTGTSAMDYDIAYMFKVNKKDSKDILSTLCSAHKRGVSASVSKTYTTKTGENVQISEYEATEVVSSRLEEILKLAKKEINLLTKKEIHYIMISGGVSEMTNFNFLVEEVFGRNANIGSTKEIGARSNIYSPSIGLIKYISDKEENRRKEFSTFDENEIEELSSVTKKINFGENSILGKLFGYFFDN